jgi:hypothetical protein
MLDFLTTFQDFFCYSQTAAPFSSSRVIRPYWLLQGFSIIEEEGQNLGLTASVIYLAKEHYQEIHKRKTIVHNQVVEDADTEDALEREKRERYKRECVDINRYSQPTIVTACVFLAIRREETTHSFKEILGAAKKWAVARTELNRFAPLTIVVALPMCLHGK